ncbi:methyl-accepting chemotaxis protein [Desulfocicer niacini]
MLKRLDLKNKMLLSIGSVALTAFAVTIFLITTQASKLIKAEAMKNAEQLGYRYANEVSKELDTAMNAARTTAHLFEGLKKTPQTPQREALNDMLKQLLELNPNFLGVWTCWEPDALDGRDNDFKDEKGHDNTGRFIPYWYRNNGKVALDPLVDYNTTGAGDYYQLALKSGKETILDPYPYDIGGEEVLLTSLVVPIRYKGRVAGVVGVDISLKSFTAMVSKITPYDTGDAAIISNSGIYVAHQDAAREGKDIGNTLIWENIKKSVKSGKFHTILDYSTHLSTDVERIVVPIQIGLSETPWGFLVNIPMDKVMLGAKRILYSSITIGAVALIILMAVVYFIARGISAPINRIVSGLKEGASQVATAAGQISSASHSLAEGASEQAASIEETSSSMEEMTSMTRKTAENSKHADTLTREASNVVEEANQAMKSLTYSMGEISGASVETSKIIKTIDEIAFQTNLLALNAAVEAARAGEAGAGFAVVANEVRNLAMRAADAAKNTAALIEDTVKKVNDGSALVATTDESFSKVAQSTAKVAALVSEISEASNEQSRGIEQVNIAISEMDKVVQQNAGNAEESASASEELNAQAAQLYAHVRDIATIITGKIESSGQPHQRLPQKKKSSGVRSSQPVKARITPKSSSEQLKLPKHNEVRPEELIPFDDDFENF